MSPTYSKNSLENTLSERPTDTVPGMYTKKTYTGQVSAVQNYKKKVEKFGFFNFLFLYGNYNHNKYVKKCHLQ